jgi:hypothetical protein
MLDINMITVMENWLQSRFWVLKNKICFMESMNIISKNYWVIKSRWQVRY